MQGFGACVFQVSGFRGLPLGRSGLHRLGGGFRVIRCQGLWTSS